jgi:hypothetical protein
MKGSHGKEKNEKWTHVTLNRTWDRHKNLRRTARDI